MDDAISQITFWYQKYYADGFFSIMIVAAYLYLFVYEYKIRKRFLYPIGILAFCIVNPFLYLFIFHQIVYWRLFWAIPGSIMVAYAITKMVQNGRHKTDKVIILFIFMLLFLLKGTNVYLNADFSLILNFEKISEPVKNICDVMLDIEEKPRCILPSPLLCEARQYSGEIESMYGRNVHGYIMMASIEQQEMYQMMESTHPDFDLILSRASELNYDFIVTYQKNIINEALLEQYQYREVGVLEGYRIYYSGKSYVSRLEDNEYECTGKK